MKESETTSLPDVQIHIEAPRRVNLGETFSIHLEIEDPQFSTLSLLPDQSIAVYVKPTAYHISDRARFFSNLPAKDESGLQFELQATHSGLEIIEIEFFIGSVRLTTRSLELQAVAKRCDTRLPERPQSSESAVELVT